MHVYILMQLEIRIAFQEDSLLFRQVILVKLNQPFNGFPISPERKGRIMKTALNENSYRHGFAL